jgi:putative DNA primase/helicase
MEVLKQRRHTAQEVAHLLGGRTPRASNGWYNCKCPCTHNHAHGDKNPSCGVKDGEDGNLIAHCQTGCQPREIYEALRAKGISFYEKEFQPISSKVKQFPRGKKELVAEYPYYSEEGELLYTKIRFSDKTFSYAPTGASEKFVLYNLPMIKMARENGWTVYLCEGEKDAESVGSFDLIGTSSTEGASTGSVKWRESYTQSLAGLDVVIFEDNDDAGRNHASGVAALLHGRANSVKIVSFPELPVKGDVTDYLQDHTKEELLERVEKAPFFIPPQEVRRFDLSEFGNGMRLVHYAAGRLRYCPKMAVPWFCFNGKVWKQSEVAAEKLAKEVVSLIPQEAKFYPDEEDVWASSASESKRKKKALDGFISHIRASNKYTSGIKNTLLCARSESGIEADVNEFDAHSGGIFNANNGTIDLRSGTLRPHNKEDFLTKISPIDYDPTAKAPRWEQFMDEICQGNQQLVEFWQCLLGYMLTGEANQRVFIVLYGGGRNGKSTLVETISRILGDDYAAGLPTTTIYARKFDEQVTTPELARLRGARFVYASEGEEKKKLAVGMVKRLSGDEKITVRPLHKEPFDFQPMFTMFFSTNHPPEITDTTDAIWDRVKLVPFNRRFERHEADPSLKRTFIEQSKGILAWVVEGAVKFYQNGMKLPECDAVTAATAKYRAEEDVVGRFLEECCEQGTDKEIQSKKLHDRFLRWCSDNGNEPLSQIALSKRLQEKGFDTKEGFRGRTFWKRLDLIESGDNSLNDGWGSERY